MERLLVRVQRVDRSDATVARQVRAARGILAWSQADLAARSGVAPRTLADLETGRRMPRDGTVDRLKSVFAQAGIEFFEDAGQIAITWTDPDKSTEA